MVTPHEAHHAPKPVGFARILTAFCLHKTKSSTCALARHVKSIRHKVRINRHRRDHIRELQHLLHYIHWHTTL